MYVYKESLSRLYSRLSKTFKILKISFKSFFFRAIIFEPISYMIKFNKFKRENFRTLVTLFLNIDTNLQLYTCNTLV